MSVMVCPCMFCVVLSMDLFALCVCEVFDETIRNWFECVCNFLVECDGVVCGWSALLDRPCMVFHRICVLCLWSQ